MTEFLALPGWNTPPVTLDAWVAQLAAQGHPPTLTRDEPGTCWLEVGALRLRGYAVNEGDHLGAINFELSDPDPEPALHVVEAAARALGWEVHPDEPDEEEDLDED
ncbi:MAG TPA: hypothetical protein VF590_14675 [Isosphaeraceae bacterium]|jgi:hypothetical protein